MTYFTEYETGLIGALTLMSDGESLTGCWFENGRFLEGAERDFLRCDDGGLPVFDQAREWLDAYFAKKRPAIDELPLKPAGTPFRLLVWEELKEIPYGQTITYGQLAALIARETGHNASARAVGGAVGRNPLGVIVPCHRVVGAHGNLTGFAGGLDAKVALLEHEGVSMAGFHSPA